MSALRIKLLRPVYYLGLFLVMAPLLVYFFSQNPPGAGAISTISTTDESASVSGTAQRKIVQSSNGTILAFYYQSAIVNIAFRKSTDNGASWSSETGISGSLLSEVPSFSVAIDSNDHVYVAYTQLNSITAVKISHSAGTWSQGTDATVFVGSTCDLGITSGTIFSDPTVVVNSSNKIWISARSRFLPAIDCSETTNTISTSSSTDGVTWTGNAGNITVSSTSSLTTPMVAIGTDLWMLISGGDTNSGIWKDTASAGSWTLITANTTTGSATSLTSGGSDQLDLFYKNGSNVLVYRKYTISTTTLGSETTISAAANDNIGSISSDGANLYAFYQSFVAVDSYNVVYKKFNGSTWDGSSTAITSDNANNVSIGSVAKRAGASYIPLLWSTGTALPYTVKGHAVSTVVTGSAPAAPTLLFPPNSETGVVHRPHFELRATDADGDYLKYKIEICSASDCSVIVRTIDQTSSQTGWAGQDQQTSTAYTGSTTLSSSTIAQHNYQNPPLAVSTQYWWRAYAIDPGGGNTFSSPSSIFTFTTAAAIPIQFQPNTTIRGGTKIN